ncbi:MAG: hypothetical protein ACKO2L_11110 [Planctomycetaceae bacterium]
MSDDQIAVLGSFAALAFCGVLMALSYHFGAAGKQKTMRKPAATPAAAAQQTSISDRRAA